MPIYSTDYASDFAWNWLNFKPVEIACKCCGELVAERTDTSIRFFKESMNCLQAFRTSLKEPVIINSGHRCKKHNQESLGAKNSLHLRIAFDIRVAKAKQPAIVERLLDAGFQGIGLYNSFVHADLGPVRWWNYSDVNQFDATIEKMLNNRK